MIDVANAWRTELQHRLRQAVEHAEERHLFLQLHEIVEERAAVSRVEDGPHELQDGLLVLSIGRNPAGVDFGFFQRLEHELGDPPHELIVDLAGRPRAEQRLIEQVLLVAIGRHTALHGDPLASVQPSPAGQRRPPVARQLREHVDPRPNVLTALGVVG